MDFRRQIVTCLFSMLRLSFETQKIKENYAILKKNPRLSYFGTAIGSNWPLRSRGMEMTDAPCSVWIFFG